MPRHRRPDPRLALAVACVSLAIASALAGLFVLALVASWPLALATADAAMTFRFLGGTLVLVGIVAAALVARRMAAPIGAFRRRTGRRAAEWRWEEEQE